MTKRRLPLVLIAVLAAVIPALANAPAISLMMAVGHRVAVSCTGRLDLQQQREHSVLLACEPDDQPPPPDHPMECAPGEIAVDAQDWWTAGRAGSHDFGHLHTSLCWPHWSVIHEPLTVRVRSVMHENPGAFYRLMVQALVDGLEQGRICGDDTAVDCRSFRPARTIENCLATGGELQGERTCAWYDDLIIDPGVLARSGWKEFRFRGFVQQSTGDSMRTSTSLFAEVISGAPEEDRQKELRRVEGRGWYTGAGYARAALFDSPLEPVSGVWRPYVELVRGAEGLPIARHMAALDTDAHEGDPGIPLQSGRGSFTGRLEIDTRNLANGWHRLFLRAEAEHGSGSNNHAALVVWFLVQN